MFRQGFMEWEDYKSKISFMDDFCWQQSVRRENIRNLPF